MLRFLFVAALLTASLSVLPATAYAQGQAGDAYQGRAVRDAKGVVLGVIEKVVLDARGRPAQALVRVQGHPSAGLRSLAVSGLVADAAGFTTPLTKAEFDAMPAVQLDEPGA